MTKTPRAAKANPPARSRAPRLAPHVGEGGPIEDDGNAMAPTQPETMPADASPGADDISRQELDAIRRRAHEIWIEEGCPEGRDREHWERAELEMLKGRSVG